MNDKPRVLAWRMSRWRREDIRAGSRAGCSPVFVLASVETPTIEKEESTRVDLALPWNVIVHNDPVNLMSYVTMVFQRVFGFTREKAEHHMLEVHQLGRSILWSGMRERAELYVQQLHQHLLLATIEKAA